MYHTGTQVNQSSFEVNKRRALETRNNYDFATRNVFIINCYYEMLSYYCHYELKCVLFAAVVAKHYFLVCF